MAAPLWRGAGALCLLALLFQECTRASCGKSAACADMACLSYPVECTRASCGGGAACADMACLSYPVVSISVSDYSVQEPGSGLASASVRVASPSATLK
ncbi:hypothetical protein T484DRAFT_1826653 [Baffinella frigidus]|nr:hypothetical protein T484DRAFT_1826653 [Cryptophyta sp. CCMP2293]